MHGLASLTDPTTRSTLLRIAKVVIVPLVSAFLAYGTAQFARGRDAQRLDRLEQDNARTVTQGEFKLWTEAQEKAFNRFDEQLREIKQDVRELKK